MAARRAAVRRRGLLRDSPIQVERGDKKSSGKIYFTASEDCALAARLIFRDLRQLGTFRTWCLFKGLHFACFSSLLHVTEVKAGIGDQNALTARKDSAPLQGKHFTGKARIKCAEDLRGLHAYY